MTDLTLTLQEKEIYYSMLYKFGILLIYSYEITMFWRANEIVDCNYDNIKTTTP